MKRKLLLSEIDSLCSKFLWKGKLDGTGASKVAWDKVCAPKQEGGLGFEELGLLEHRICEKADLATLLQARLYLGYLVSHRSPRVFSYTLIVCNLVVTFPSSPAN